MGRELITSSTVSSPLPNILASGFISAHLRWATATLAMSVLVMPRLAMNSLMIMP